MIELLGLRTVIYPTTDLAASTAWWTEVLGFGPYFEEPYYVGFDVAGYELGLLPDANPADGAHVYWRVEDVAAAVGDSIGRGATLHTAAQDVGGGIITASVVAPDGSIVGFISAPAAGG